MRSQKQKEKLMTKDLFLKSTHQSNQLDITHQKIRTNLIFSLLITVLSEGAHSLRRCLITIIMKC